MRRPSLMYGVVALVAVAVLAGIADADAIERGDSTPESSAPDGTEEAQAAESGPPTVSAPNSTADGDRPDGAGLPVDTEFQIDMMLGLVPDEEMNEFFDQQSQVLELQIQACMNDAGFDYVPEDNGAADVDLYSGMSQLEWAQQYGFGVWTQLDPNNNPFAGQHSEWSNGEIIDNLSPAEQAAWYEWSDRCRDDASGDPADPWTNPMVQEILEDFTVQVENDPRFREALAIWQECMAGSGHPFASQDEMWEVVWGQAEGDIWERQFQFLESEAWLETSPDHVEWQALVDEEIEIAVADATCTPPMDEVRAAVQRDLRPSLVEVWQTIDWSLPPVTYDDSETFPGDPVAEIGTEGNAATTVAGESDGTSIGSSESTETPVGLDLAEPIETTTDG